MNIGSGLDTVSSLYGQQKSNYMKAPASAEKTFYTAETPKVYQIFTTDNMLWTGGNGTGLSYCLKYADDSTDENPVVLAKGVDENGKEFEQRIYINDVNPSSATVVEMRALEAHYKVEKHDFALFHFLPYGHADRGTVGIQGVKSIVMVYLDIVSIPAAPSVDGIGNGDCAICRCQNRCTTRSADIGSAVVGNFSSKGVLTVSKP